MKIIILDDEQRKRIVNVVKPSKRDSFSYQNLDLLTAVLDEQTGNILTRTYFLSSAIRRTDETYDEYRFVLLTDKGDFIIPCCNTRGVYAGIRSPFPMQVSNGTVHEMIEYYEKSFSERWDMSVTEEKKMSLGNKTFTEWYLEKELPE